MSKPILSTARSFTMALNADLQDHANLEDSAPKVQRTLRRTHRISRLLKPRASVAQPDFANHGELQVRDTSGTGIPCGAPSSAGPARDTNANSARKGTS